MALKTKNKKEKELRDLAIKYDFKILSKVKGSQKTAIYEKLAAKYDVSVSSIGRIVNR